MRTAILYDWEGCGTMTIRGREVARQDYEFSTQAHERQVADDLAKVNGVQHGHVAIMDGCMCLDKLRVYA